MADLGVKKEPLSTTIKALPKELLMEVLARVASGSISDLYKVKLSCKEFLHASEDDYVYHHASMDKFPLVPLSWFAKKKEFSFLKRCRESGNSEIFYREGMVEYFSSLRVESGLENLKRAAREGHKESKYVYCMILMCSEDDEERKQGFDIFCSLRKSTCIRRCRKRVKSFVRSMWVNNHPVIPNNKSLCHSSTCDVISGRLQKLSRGWSYSSLFQDEDDDGIDISCEYCSGDLELGLFCNIFEV